MSKLFVALAGAVMFAAPSVALACSGPRAHEVMAASTARGWTLFFVNSIVAAGIVLACAILRRHPVGAIMAVALGVSHPASWISAYMGDCGWMRDIACVTWLVFTSLVAAAVIVAGFQRSNSKT